MIDLGKHAIYIWTSYGVVFASLLGVGLWLIWDGKKQQAQLDDFEARGVRRRSDRSDRSGDDS